jgi:TPR repeat protein
VRYHVAVKAAILFFLLCAPALADLSAGLQAMKNSDYATALKEFLPLAKQGDAVAQLYLGGIYYFAFGVPQDYKESVRWYRLAADRGNAYSQSCIGSMYEWGNGVPQDYTQAHMWFNLAGASGKADAIKYRDSVACKMTSDQIAEAQRLAREWKPKTSQ